MRGGQGDVKVVQFLKWERDGKDSILVDMKIVKFTKIK